VSGRPDYDVGDVVVKVAYAPDGYGVLDGGKYSRIGSIGRVATLDTVDDGIWDVMFHDEAGIYYCANTFRKIDAADEAFTRQMRAIKPAKVAA